jgi:hypothetical protein
MDRPRDHAAIRTRMPQITWRTTVAHHPTEDTDAYDV